ncbi:outer membrane beta-barrel protein [Salinimicrobium sp. TH3]|uniref:outer membrane beta-barrel protein n=1 Tax=Salinimicrobium sp. TH3 TaxID=2997342 RepID=UPI0022731548|nr:outer membrane beta-barrel protein [Salinimicrobium sp. TH3]MCY2687785.1 outer membrane beta-barrel protein [Salinimicrobium sp. TH3]
MNKNILLVICLGFFSFSSIAQVKLNNISAGASYWHRTYSEQNEKFFLISYDANEDFTQGGVMPHLGAELNLFQNLALDARVGYWTADYEAQGKFGELRLDEKIEQTIIPVSAGLVYRFPNLVREDLNLFVGAGMNRYFIQNKVSRTITGGTGTNEEDTFSGNSYGVNAKAGLEYYFTDALGLALETRYNAGYYNQTFQAVTTEEPVRERVSVRGLEVGLSLRYRFSGSSAEATANE